MSKAAKKLCYPYDSLTPEEAAFVRRARVEQHETWRGVASVFFAEYGAAREIPEELAWNQIYGRDLCELAAKHFGEDAIKKPWN